MAATETAESGSPENKVDRADGDANYPLKVLYCGGKRNFLQKFLTSSRVSEWILLSGYCLCGISVCVFSCRFLSISEKKQQHTSR